MYRYIFISLIGHLLLGALIILITLFQPNYRRIPKQKVTRVKFYNLPTPPPKKPSPPQNTTVRETRPQPTPRPTPPPRKIIKKEEKKATPKPQKTPVPKQTKAAPTPKPAPQRTPQATPRPQRTVWPPTPRPDEARVKPTPAPQPPVPTPSPNTSVQISHSNLPSYYLLMATQKIESNFNLTRSQRYEGIDCIVEFKVNKEGNIYDVKISKSTGQSSLDQFALDAVTNTASLGPLPDSIGESFISITARFEYSPDSN